MVRSKRCLPSKGSKHPPNKCTGCALIGTSFPVAGGCDTYLATAHTKGPVHLFWGRVRGLGGSKKACFNNPKIHYKKLGPTTRENLFVLFVQSKEQRKKPLWSDEVRLKGCSLTPKSCSPTGNPKKIYRRGKFLSGSNSCQEKLCQKR